MDIAFVNRELPSSGAVVVGIADERMLLPAAAQLDRLTKGQVTKAIEASRFKGKRRESLTILAPSGLDLSRILLIGVGKPGALTTVVAEELGGEMFAQLGGSGEKSAFVWIDQPEGAEIGDAALAAHLAYGALLRGYRFDRYRTREKEEQKPSLENLRVSTADGADCETLFASLNAVASGVSFARDLASEPANVIYPETLAEQAETLRDLGVDVEVFGENEMGKLGMGSLLGVGQGSARESRMVVMQWRGAPDAPDPSPLAFVGKGVTFDTGGISIKPAGGMEDMKWDMGGSAVVIGLMKALAARKAKVNAVGAVGLVENMPDGNAQRPGDIVKSMSGQTIEVLNTDAEGRLVLADVLWYTQEKFKPKFMIDLATLTGAIIISLGNEHAGLFSNNDELAERLTQAGKDVGELVWRMPLSDAYDKELDCDAADMKNIGGGRGAGSITAAQFLQRFVNKVDWAHLDIAGVTWSKKDRPVTPKGATGFGVRLLDRLVRNHYESRA